MSVAVSTWMGDHRGRSIVRDKTPMVERWRTSFGKVFKFFCHVPEIFVDFRVKRTFIFILYRYMCYFIYIVLHYSVNKVGLVAARRFGRVVRQVVFAPTRSALGSNL